MFEALERLSDDDLTGEELQIEIKRAKSMAQLGKVIVENAAVTLDAKKYVDEYRSDVPKYLLGNGR
jgi:non-homologous end joining protein Ku